MDDPRYGSFLSNLGIKNPRRKGVGFDYSPITVQQGQPTQGQQLFDKVAGRKDRGGEIYNRNRQETTQRVASDIAGKSAFNIPTDEFGIVNQQLTDFRPTYNQRIQSIGQRGKLALQTEEAKTAWHQANALQDLGQYGFSGGVSIQGNGTDIPGATGDNPGAKAVSLAMKALQNKTPYVWGGNSLNQGVDCSGLVQQVYRQLGIEVPRTTWEQAKHGKRVGFNEMRPGDLIFYNKFGHVGIYIGNGKFVHASNETDGIITSSVMNSSNGKPLLAIRPY